LNTLGKNNATKPCHQFAAYLEESPASMAFPAGRVLQLGDSAHTFFPMSGKGATQAMEDTVTIATCLQLAGKSGSPLTVKVHNKALVSS
jgi:2-polyprenyl-6-methoxyphenol hydroxylase-like FAD-dependent oxidoreductase